MLQWPEDQFEKVLAHELGHVLGFFHVFEGGYVMGFPEAAVWSAEESEYAQLAYRVGPNVRYPGLLRDDDLPPGDDGERAALTALYDATDGRNWNDGTHWDSGEPLARWHGVLTDDDGRVTGLSLPANNLAGPLPAALGRLKRLTLMELDRNALSGPLPAELGTLTRLTELRLVANELTGPLPAELAELAELRHLSLQQNDLSGAVPAWLGGLTRLRWLDFAFNGLSGPLPAELGGLADLQALVLNRNDLSGAVPAALGDLSSLRYLEVAGNKRTAARVADGPAAAGNPLYRRQRRAVRAGRRRVPGVACDRARLPGRDLRRRAGTRAAGADSGYRRAAAGRARHGHRPPRRSDAFRELVEAASTILTAYASCFIRTQTLPRLASARVRFRRVKLDTNPHFSPAFCYGRRSARRGGPYSLTPLRRSHGYACSGIVRWGCAALSGWACAPNPRRLLAGTPSPRAAAAGPRRARYIQMGLRPKPPAAACGDPFAPRRCRRAAPCAVYPDGAAPQTPGGCLRGPLCPAPLPPGRAVRGCRSIRRGDSMTSRRTLGKAGYGDRED